MRTLFSVFRRTCGVRIISGKNWLEIPQPPGPLWILSQKPQKFINISVGKNMQQKKNEEKNMNVIRVRGT